jgi:hypothetical protein
MWLYLLPDGVMLEIRFLSRVLFSPANVEESHFEAAPPDKSRLGKIARLNPSKDLRCGESRLSSGSSDKPFVFSKSIFWGCQ